MQRRRSSRALGRLLLAAIGMLLSILVYGRSTLSEDAPAAPDGSSALESAEAGAVAGGPLAPLAERPGTGPAKRPALRMVDRLTERPLAFAPPSRRPLLLADPAESHPGVQVATATRFYDVEGQDITAILASVRERGPRDHDGNWAASTAWTFRWWYEPVEGAGCGVGAARVELELRYTYPRWLADPAAAWEVESAWSRYLERVELHERGHGEIAVAAASELARALEALQAHASCDDLAAAADATARELLARHAQRQIAYDRATRHGASQGATLAAER